MTKQRIAFEVEADPDLVISTNYKHFKESLSSLGIKLRKLHIEIRQIASVSETSDKIKLTKLLSDNKSIPLEYKDLYVPTEISSQQLQLGKKISVNTSNSINYLQYIKDFYNNNCNFLLFNNFTNLYTDKSIESMSDFISSLEEISSFGVEVDYFYQGTYESINYSMSLSNLRFIYEFDTKDANKLFEELNTDLDEKNQIQIQQEKDVFCLNQFIRTKSGAFLQIRQNTITLTFSESRPNYSRKILYDVLKEIVPTPLSKLSLKQVKSQSYFSVLFSSNSADQSTSFIKFYYLNSLMTIGILPIKFDKCFFLTKIGGVFDPVRNYEFVIFINNMIKYILDNILSNETVFSIDYDNYLKYQYMLYDL